MQQPLLETLSNHHTRKQLTTHEVMRRLVTHDGWFAPLAWACDALATESFEHVLDAGGELEAPANELWLYTSVDVCYEASRDLNLGLYAGPLTGTELFERIPRQGIASIRVNPGLRAEHTWEWPEPSVETARLWGAAVALERELSTKGEWMTRLLDFDGYLVPISPDGTLVTVAGIGGMKNPALAFTTMDTLQTVITSRSAGPIAVLSGEHLFELLGRSESRGVDGLALVIGPKKIRPFDANACRSLAEIIASRVQRPADIDDPW